MNNLKKNDLVIHNTGKIVTVLKVYKADDTGQVYIQGLADCEIIYDKIEFFRPMDVLLLRCNSCSREVYEIDLNVNHKGLYICDCGSSTFSPLNLDLEEINY